MLLLSRRVKQNLVRMVLWDPASAFEADQTEDTLAGLRETKKAEKRREIQRVVLEALRDKGFERTTIREIAERAGVAEGTLFLYAQSKTDLFLMSINEDLDRLADVEIECGQSILDQLIAFFRPRYAFWAGHPDLYLAAVREMSTAYAPFGPDVELAKGIGRRADSLQRVLDVLHRGVQHNQLRANVDINCVGRIILDVYLSELRFWLCGNRPELETGMIKLRQLLGLIIDLTSI